jgi:hypothetical protein
MIPEAILRNWISHSNANELTKTLVKAMVPHEIMGEWVEGCWLYTNFWRRSLNAVSLGLLTAYYLRKAKNPNTARIKYTGRALDDKRAEYWYLALKSTCSTGVLKQACLSMADIYRPWSDKTHISVGFYTLCLFLNSRGLLAARAYHGRAGVYILHHSHFTSGTTWLPFDYRAAESDLKDALRIAEGLADNALVTQIQNSQHALSELSSLRDLEAEQRDQAEHQ